MSGFLLDTNVVSEFARPDNQPEQRVKQWLETVDSDSLYASVLTCGEIRKGIEKLSPGRRRSHLEAWLERDLHEWFEDRLLVVDEPIANYCQSLGMACSSGKTKWDGTGSNRWTTVCNRVGAQPHRCYAE